MAKLLKLGDLLKNLRPELDEGKYYFASVPESQLFGLVNYLSYVTSIHREEEGLSIVFSEEILEEMKSYGEGEPAGPFALITLKVESDLMAVGLLAKITGELAREGISANTVSAYHHDYLLVPFGKKEAAMKVLKKLQNP